ncbi:MAG: hypothetical protein EOO43_25075, partial [Flavobacterium sp.]
MYMNNSSNNIRENKESEEISIDLKQIVGKLTDKWLWFLCSIIICLLISVIYSKQIAPIYQINSKLLIMDQDKGGISKSNALMDLGGLMGGGNSVENEVEILKSRFLVEQVVKDMGLNIVYYSKGKIGMREIYSPPFQLIVRNIPTQKVHIEIEKINGNKLKVSTNDFDKEVAWNEVFNVNGVGDLQLIPSGNT